MTDNIQGTDDTMPILNATLLGAIPSPPDARDFDLSAKLDLAAPLPARFVNLLMPPTLNQGNTGRCTSFASTGLKGWEERRDNHGFMPFDPQWLYDKAQKIDGIPLPHEGSTLRANLTILKNEGLALQGHPEVASHFKIASYWAVPQTYESIKAAVFQYGPILIAEKWDNAWFKPAAGILPPPSGKVAGGHATLVFGWDDNVAGGSLLIRNSWGRLWGVNGNFYAPKSYFIPAVHDAWAALDIKGD